jgi:hypothetical protein
LLWGEDVHVGWEFPYFNGLLLGALSEWDAFTTVGSSPGGFFLQEVHLCYATPPNAPGQLIRMGEDR